VNATSFLYWRYIAVAAVKERQVIAIVGVKPEERVVTPQLGGHGPDEPPPPPPRPPGGGSGGPKAKGWGWVLFIVLLWTVAFNFFSSTSFAVLFDVGNAVGSGAVTFETMLGAWAVLIAVGVLWLRASVSEDIIPDATSRFERKKIEYKRKLIQQYWDGLLIIVICFYAAAFTKQFELIQVIEIVAILVTLAHIVERLRLRYFPQNTRDIVDFLSSAGVSGHAARPR
jgi:hypothetical protein